MPDNTTNGRYERHHLIDWFDQEGISSASIIVVGAGAIGNEVLKNLALLGVGQIDVFDFDSVEVHNLTRSILFSEQDIGRPKAEVVAEKCATIDESISVHGWNGNFWNLLTLEMLKNADCVIAAVDNFDARVKLNQLCRLVGIDFISTGIDSRWVSIEYYPHSISKALACYECTLPLSAYDSILRRYSCGWLRKQSIEEKRIPTTTVTSSIAGAVACSIALSQLSNHPAALKEPTKFLVDAITLESTKTRIVKNEECICCSEPIPNSEILSALRSMPLGSVLPSVNDPATAIVLSERVVLSTTCSICSKVIEYYESVHSVNESILYCSDCGEISCIPDYAYDLNAKDYVEVFADHANPCKYVTVHSGERPVVIFLRN